MKTAFGKLAKLVGRVSKAGAKNAEKSAEKAAKTRSPVFLRPVSLVAHHVPTSAIAVEYAQHEANDDVVRKDRRATKRTLRVRLGGYYKIKGSDARKNAATGRVPSHVSSPEVYIPQKEPLRPETKRKHRGAQAYRRRQLKRHGIGNPRAGASAVGMHRILGLLPPDLR